MNSPRHVKLFWTGGWDSTYMLCLFSRHKSYDVQPIYVQNPGRHSNQLELNRMKKIIKLLQAHPGTKAKLHDVKIVPLSDINVTDDYFAAHRKLAATTRLGAQYRYLAAYANEHGPICLGIEKSPNDIAASTIKLFGKIHKSDTLGYRIDQSKSSDELNLIFGNLIFPLYDITEVEMLKDVKKWGYLQIMEQIWFCHYPINQQPCGLCNPCFSKMASKMEFLLPDSAQKRYYAALKYNKLGKTLSLAIRKLILKFRYHAY